MISKTPPPVADRPDEEGDWIIRQFISPDDLGLSPEEYVARHAHDLGGFGFASYRFRDPNLGSWVGRVAELLASEAEVERCRSLFLSAEERAFALRRAAEAW